MSKHKTHFPLTVLPNHHMMASGDGRNDGRCRHAEGHARLWGCPLLLWVLILLGSPGPGAPRGCHRCVPRTVPGWDSEILVEQMRLPPVREGNSCSQHAPEAPGDSLSLCSERPFGLAHEAALQRRAGVGCVYWQLSSATHPPVTSRSL